MMIQIWSPREAVFHQNRTQLILFNIYLAPFDQGGLYKKEIQLNFCNIFSIFIFNELYLFV